MQILHSNGMRCFFISEISLVIVLLLSQKSLSKNICQWNSRKIISTSGYYKLTTLSPSYYSKGFINGQKFSTSWWKLYTCETDSRSFQCYSGKTHGLDVTTLEFENITGVDAVVINSTYPITVHRVKKPAISTKIPRFHLVESTEFNYCPKWDRLNLTWTLIGDVTSTQPLTCFANKTKLCEGTTIDISEKSGKCVVSEVSGQVNFTLTVSRQNATRLSFYYCQLNATLGEIVTYVVDWRDSSPLPAGGIPPVILPTPPTFLPLLTCNEKRERRGTI
ncbi:hypothetical protein AAHC03_020871 [Spirometra sp. Aus1]